MFGDRGRRSIVIIVNIEVPTGCFLFDVRHFSCMVVVWGGSVIDDIYVSRIYTYRLSSEAIAIMVASAIMFVEIRLFRISHFGMNPERGGSPPMDRTVIDRTVMVYGELVHMVPRSLIVIDIVRLISRNVGIVVMM